MLGSAVTGGVATLGLAESSTIRQGRGVVPRQPLEGHRRTSDYPKDYPKLPQRLPENCPKVARSAELMHAAERILAVLRAEPGITQSLIAETEART